RFPLVDGGRRAAGAGWIGGDGRMNKDIRAAMLGDHEAAKRLTDAGVLVPCPGCGGDNSVDWYRHNEVWYQCDDCGWKGPSVYSGGFADTEQARLAWNTRAGVKEE